MLWTTDMTCNVFGGTLNLNQPRSPLVVNLFVSAISTGLTGVMWQRSSERRWMVQSVRSSSTPALSGPMGSRLVCIYNTTTTLLSFYLLPFPSGWTMSSGHRTDICS